LHKKCLKLKRTLKTKAPINRHTKTKVILGFGVAILAVFLTGYITYISFSKLLTSVNALSDPNPKLVRLNDVLKHLSKAESNLRIYTLTDNADELSYYHKNIATVQSNIDTLRQLTESDSSQHAAIDEISLLLSEKVANLNSLTEIRKSLKNRDLSAEAMKKIAQLKKKSEANRTVLSSTKTTEVRTENRASQAQVITEQEEETEGLMGRLRKLVGKPSRRKAEQPVLQNNPEVTTETTVVIDTIAMSKPDVIIGSVKKILEDLHGEEYKNQQLLSTKEAELIDKSMRLKDRIITLLNDLEKKELENSQRERTEARMVAESSSIILAGILAICLLSSLVFALVIFGDINKSSYYRKQLVQAKQKSEHLAKVKQEFLANMSHEIRTPLGAILGFSEQLSKQSLTAEQQYFVEAIKSSSDFLLSTVNEILDLSKIEAGKLEVESIPFSLEEALVSTCNTFGLKAAEKNISLTYYMDQGMPDALVGDPFRLKQVLFNLVSNAIKFTERGSVEIHARLEKADENSARIQIQVSDTGIGISPGNLQTIFEDFSQADSSTTRKYGGTGLGLSICKKLLELQGGHIKVESQPGEGTTFTFSITYIKDKQQPKLTDKQLVSFRMPEDLRVLVIDDDNYNITLCKAILTDWGLEPDLVTGGKEAIRKLEEHDYDVVLTDIHMPEVSGIDIARFIRSQEGDKAQVPVIAFTANVIREDLEGYKETGFSTCLTKPFKAQDLYRCLVEVLPYIAHYQEEDMALCSNDSLMETPAGFKAPDLYSLEDIREFAHADEATMKAFVEKFICESRLNLSRLKQHGEDNNWIEVGELAHKMIAGYSYFRIDTVVPELKKLELLLKGQLAIAEAKALLEYVIDQSAHVLSLIEEEQQHRQEAIS
jgi:signal transduction histidine kinase/FixJ family two-component response regulator